MKRKKLPMLFVTFFLSCSVDAEENKTKFYVFGDSLSYATRTGEESGGVVTFPMYLSHLYNTELLGGAFVNGNGSLGYGHIFREVEDHLRTVSSKKGRSYIFYSGATDTSAVIYNNFLDNLSKNDMLYLLQGNDEHDNLLSLADLENRVKPFIIYDINEMATNISTSVNKVHKSGANLSIVPNQFNDIFRQYNIVDESDADAIGNINIHRVIANEYNASLYRVLDIIAPNANVVYADFDTLVNELIDNPDKYIHKNYLGDINGLFDETSHPTNQTHQIFSQYIYSILSSPSVVGLMRELPIDNGLSILDDMLNFAKKDHIMNHGSSIEPLVDYFYKRSPTSKLNGYYQASPGIRYNYHYDDSLIIGGQLRYIYNTSSFSENIGEGTAKNAFGSLHGIYKSKNNGFFSYVSSGMGVISYDIERKIDLGKSTRTENGDTKGRQYLFGAGLGNNFKLSDNIQLSPFTKVTYQTVSLNDYKEKGKRSTAMSFKTPNRESFLTELGIVLTHKADSYPIRSSLKSSYSREFKDGKDILYSKVSNMPRYFTSSIEKPTRDSFYVGTDIEYDIFSKSTAGINIGDKITTKNNHNINTRVYFRMIF